MKCVYRSLDPMEDFGFVIISVRWFRLSLDFERFGLGSQKLGEGDIA